MKRSIVCNTHDDEVVAYCPRFSARSHAYATTTLMPIDFDLDLARRLKGKGCMLVAIDVKSATPNCVPGYTRAVECTALVDDALMDGDLQ
jgi:hypothetical protein